MNNNKEWNGNIQKAYQYLYAALVKYNNAVDSKDVLDTYAQGNTNYKYLYVDTKTKKVYSDIKVSDFIQRYEDNNQILWTAIGVHGY